MKIDLSKDRRIVGAERCWELQRRRTVKGTNRWEAYKWFPSFGMAVEEAVHADIRLHPAETLAEAIEAVDQLVHRYAQLIPCEFEISRKDTTS